MRFLLITCALAASPAIGLAIERTCDGCISACCDWAYSAWDGPYDAYTRRYSRDPTPCVDVVAQHGQRSKEARQCAIKAYSSCLNRHCSKCNYPTTLSVTLGFRLFGKRLPGHFGVSGTKPLRFEPGQIIVVKKPTERGKPKQGGSP